MYRQVKIQTFIQHHNITTSEVVTVTDCTGYYQIVLPAHEINHNACTLMILTNYLIRQRNKPCSMVVQFRQGGYTVGISLLSRRILTEKSSPVDIAGMTVESKHVFRCPKCSAN